MKLERDEIIEQWQDVAEFHIRGNNEKTPEESDGILITFRSPMIHSWFSRRAIAGEIQRVREWGNMPLFVLPPQKIPFIADVTFDRPGQALLEEFITNLTFFRAVDLAAGITFEEKTLPTEPYCDSFRLGLERGVKEFYRQFLKPYDQKVRLSTQVIG